MASRGFQNWTPQMVEAHQARIKAGKRPNHIADAAAYPGKPKLDPAPAVELRKLDLVRRPTTDEAGLNKLERRYLSHLRMLKVPCLNIQAITLKLAFDCRLTCDFTYVDENGVLTFVDTKGFQREDAKIKMLTAARKFTEFRFVIVTEEGGKFVETPVKP